MEETVTYTRELAQRVGTELDIPVYCYEHAAFEEKEETWPYAGPESTRG